MRGLVESQELADRAQELEQTFSNQTTSVARRGGRIDSDRPRLVAVEVDGRSHEVRLHVTEPPWAELARRRKERAALGRRRGPATAPL